MTLTHALRLKATCNFDSQAAEVECKMKGADVQIAEFDRVTHQPIAHSEISTVNLLDATKTSQSSSTATSTSIFSGCREYKCIHILIVVDDI